MNILAAPVWAGLALLVIAGAPKIVRPLDLMRALRLAGLRVPHVLVRAFGAAEVLIGVVGLATGNRVALALAAISYLGFAGFVAMALARKTPLSSCGCFGKTDTPPTRLHVVIVGLLAVALGYSVALPAAMASLTQQFSQGLLLPALTTVFAGMICWFAYLAMATMPTAYAKPNEPQSTSRYRRPIRLTASGGSSS